MTSVADGWFGKQDCHRCIEINRGTYRKLMTKYKISAGMKEYNGSSWVDINPDDYDIIYKYIGDGYASTKYEIVKNKPCLSLDELALICDNGNLCFGYTNYGCNIIVVYTD